MSEQSFGSLIELGLHFVERQAHIAIALHEGLERVGALIENTARAEMGTYQAAVGPFPAWALLSPAYEAEKAGKGYATPNPLIRDGDMLASFQHEVEGLEVIAGATDEKMLYHELGTAKMPARPVWGPAAFRSQEAIARLIGAAAVAGLMGNVGGGMLSLPGPGYNFDVS